MSYGTLILKLCSFIVHSTATNQRCLWFLELSMICGKNCKIKWEDDFICSFFLCFIHEKTKTAKWKSKYCFFINNKNDRNKTWKNNINTCNLFWWSCCLLMKLLSLNTISYWSLSNEITTLYKMRFYQKADWWFWSFLICHLNNQWFSS